MRTADDGRGVGVVVACVPEPTVRLDRFDQRRWKTNRFLGEVYTHEHTFAYTAGMALITQRVDEADARRVEVEQPKGLAAGTKAVLDVRRHREERAGAGAMPLAPLEELDLACEHIERVGVIGVGVQVDTLEVGPERQLEGLDVRQRCEGAVAARRDPLALAGPREGRLLHPRGPRRAANSSTPR